MPLFRKKPVVIEARQTGQDYDQDCEILGWCKGNANDYPFFSIHTLEGVYNVTPGDWVIKGVEGEFYPCKPDIFEKTYEPVDKPIPEPSVDLSSTSDPMVWAEEFVRMFANQQIGSEEVVDEGLMVGWFANAMSAKDMNP
jgi:hypothetical protein